MQVHRIAPGFYATKCGRIEVHHVEMPDEGNGYGRTDEWIVVEDGHPWDGEFYTLRDARQALAAR